MPESAQRIDPERVLVEDIAAFEHDPLGFVLYAFPWGSGDLEGHDGPDAWQRELLSDIGNEIITATQAIQIARASGHDIGKSALVAWIILWSMSTREDTRGVVTANTEGQLRTKTWPEVAKWHRLSINAHWFTVTATAIFSKDKTHEKTWRIDAIPWSESNTEAFAGLHNKGKRIVLIFDEASAIIDAIWEVSEGALLDSDTEIIWCVFGNPTRNTGRFRECFGKLKHRWNHKQIDSRSCKIANKQKIGQWIEDYGEDSDFVRVRVRGIFPRASSMQFIPSDLAEGALGRIYHESEYMYAPRIMGVDIARFGDDQTVICKRQGLTCHEFMKYRELDNMAAAGVVAQEIQAWKPDAVFIDQGAGTGVIDRLRQLGYDIHEVAFGSKSSSSKYFNKRAQMWGGVKEWLRQGGALPNDDEIRDDLIGPEYGFAHNDAIQLEKKEDMKKRGLSSPDCGDALALTFAHAVHQRRLEDQDLYAQQDQGKYDPLGFMQGGRR